MPANQLQAATVSHFFMTVRTLILLNQQDFYPQLGSKTTARTPHHCATIISRVIGWTPFSEIFYVLSQFTHFEKTFVKAFVF